MDFALVLLRVLFGLAMAAHGAQKAFGWWGGPGRAGALGMMQRFRYRPPQLWVAVLMGAELGGGILFAAGFLTPLACTFLISGMIHAAWRVHLSNGFFASKGGIEVPAAYLVVALAVLCSGPGAYSLDRALRLSYPQPLTAVLGIVAACIGTVLPLALSEVDEPAPTPAAPAN